jgi:pimeloyl-ACP methyl ester carboxylesterase
MKNLVLLAALCLFVLPLRAQEAAQEPVYGGELEGFDYSYPVKRFEFRSQGNDLRMAYLDVQPAAGNAGANGRTVVLFHGKNFCAGTWETTIAALTGAGYRVIAPDQIGFCKSSKPAHYQFSFQQLARNTQALLQSLGVSRVTLLGHSTGGMVAVRYALMFPNDVEQLALVNPIGLEDWKARGVPSITVDQWYQRELANNAQRIRNYEKSTYYVGEWRPEYEKWVLMLAGLVRGPAREAVAWDSALLYDMIYTQPVVYEFENLKMPVLLLIGQRDTTAIGKDLAPPEIAKQLGHYPELGRQAAARIPHATLVEFADSGHAPQIQDPVTFHAALLKGFGALNH